MLVTILLALAPAAASAASNASHGAIVAAPDGGYVAAGKVEFSFGSVLYLLKVDAAGNEVWNKTYGEYSSFTEVRSLAAAADGYLITTTLPTSNGSCIYLLKTDLNGTQVWDKAYGEPNSSYDAEAVIAVPDGFVVTGGAGPFPYYGEHSTPWGTASHTFLLKTDRLGKMVWYKVYDGPDNDNGFAVMSVSDGYVIAGDYYFWEGWGAHVIKTDLQGDEVWNLTYGPRYDSLVNSIAPASDGYLVSGYYWRGHPGMGGPGSTAGYLIDVAPDGQVNQEYFYHITDEFDNGDFLEPAGDGYLISGTTDVYGDHSVFLFKTDLPGNNSWYKTYPGSKDSPPGSSVHEIAGTIVVEDGYVMVGPVNLKGYWQGYDRMGATGLSVFKTDLNGNVVWNRTYDDLIARERPVGLTQSPGGLKVSPAPLATPAPVSGFSALPASVALLLAAVVLFSGGCLGRVKK